MSPPFDARRIVLAGISAFLICTGPVSLGAQLTGPLQPCSVDGYDGEALCGALEVAEDPDRPDGRRIDLGVVVLPAQGDATAAPVAVLAGGPGGSASGLTGFAAQIFAGLRDDHEIVLVDARGTGRSHPLDCPEIAATTTRPEELLGPLFDPGKVRDCRRRLSQVADFTHYTTSNIADDMVRAWDAMGYERVNVYGTSYGTRLALEIMRRHPERLRAVVLKGVAPRGLRIPLNYPRDGQRALDRIFEHCRADPLCSEAYPRLERELVTVLNDLEAGVHVDLAHPMSGQTGTVVMSAAPVTQSMMALLQGAPTAAFLPRLIHAAAEGTWAPLAGWALTYRALLAGELWEGLFLSVTCAEDLPYIDPEVATAIAEDTFLGLARYEDQAAACSVWDVPPVDPTFREPVSSHIPALLVSGNYDPVTPPRWGWRAAERLERSYHLVVPEGSHSFGGMAGCVDVAISRFIRTGDPASAEDPCVDDLEIEYSLPTDPWPAIFQAEGSAGPSRSPR